MEKLTKIEIKIVNLMHRGVDQEAIKMKLNLNDKNFHIYTRSVFTKLKVTNWINAFRVSLQDINRDNLNQNESLFSNSLGKSLASAKNKSDNASSAPIEPTPNASSLARGLITDSPSHHARERDVEARYMQKINKKQYLSLPANTHNQNRDRIDSNTSALSSYIGSTVLTLPLTAFFPKEVQATMFGSIANLSNTVMGAGLLGIPFAVANCGWYLGI